MQWGFLLIPKTCMSMMRFWAAEGRLTRREWWTLRGLTREAVCLCRIRTLIWSWNPKRTTSWLEQPAPALLCLSWYQGTMRRWLGFRMPDRSWKSKRKTKRNILWIDWGPTFMRVESQRGRELTWMGKSLLSNQQPLLEPVRGRWSSKWTCLWEEDPWPLETGPEKFKGDATYSESRTRTIWTNSKRCWSFQPIKVQAKGTK